MKYAQSARVFERKNGKSSKFLLSSFQVSQSCCRFCVVCRDCVFLVFQLSSGMHQLVFRISAGRSKIGACLMEAFRFLPRVAVRIFAFPSSGGPLPSGRLRESQVSTRVVIINCRLHRKYLLEGLGAQNFLMTCL